MQIAKFARKMAVLLAFKASKTINLGSFARLNSRKAGKRVALQVVEFKKIHGKQGKLVAFVNLNV